MRKSDKLKNIKENNILMEQRSNDTYFETLSGALDKVRETAQKLGFTVDEDEMFSQFGTGGIPYGQTKRANITLLKNGEPITTKSGKSINRSLVVVIYRMDSGRYELTLYKSW